MEIRERAIHNLPEYGYWKEKLKIVEPLTKVRQFSLDFSWYPKGSPISGNKTILGIHVDCRM
jgi:hypothetical protein